VSDRDCDVETVRVSSWDSDKNRDFDDDKELDSSNVLDRVWDPERESLGDIVKDMDDVCVSAYEFDLDEDSLVDGSSVIVLNIVFDALHDVDTVRVPILESERDPEIVLEGDR